MPLAENYLAAERAVYECALAGCESIWITVNDDWLPLIKDRLGDYIQDPVWFKRAHEQYYNEHKKYIPIFYVPHFPKYRKRRDSLGWGIVNSAIYAHKVAKALSDLATPNMFYGCFTQAVYDPRTIRKKRERISSKENFYLTHKKKSIKTGHMLGFTFSWEDVKKINQFIHKEGTGLYVKTGEFVKGDRSAWSQKLPSEEQNSACKFSIEKVFEVLVFDEGAKHEVDYFYEIDDWSSYKNFLKADIALHRPESMEKNIIFHPIGVDND